MNIDCKENRLITSKFRPDWDNHYLKLKCCYWVNQIILQDLFLFLFAFIIAKFDEGFIFSQKIFNHSSFTLEILYIILIVLRVTILNVLCYRPSNIALFGLRRFQNYFVFEQFTNCFITILQILYSSIMYPLWLFFCYWRAWVIFNKTFDCVHSYFFPIFVCNLSNHQNDM